MAYAPVPGTDGWSIAVNAPKIDFMNATYTGIFIIAMLVVVALIAAFFLALFLANGIGRPIRICAACPGGFGVRGRGNPCKG